MLVKHDVDARQKLGEIAIAFIGDDDGAAGLGDQEIGAGDAHIGAQEFIAQHAARLGDQLGRLGSERSGGRCVCTPAEIGLDLIAVEMHGRRDDVARALRRGSG